MKKSPKNYIYYKGGSFGDITSLIVNDMIRPENDVQIQLKCRADVGTEHPDIDKSLLDKQPVETLVGHNRTILGYGYTNYKITFSDPSIRQIASGRFAKASGYDDIAHVVEHYYPSELHDTIKALPLKKQIDLLNKKYDNDIEVNAINLDLSCIFDKEKYIDMLSNYFTFDKVLANKTYDLWSGAGIPIEINRAKNNNVCSFKQMVVLLPYPNGMTYPEMGDEHDIFQYANDIRNYVSLVCKGPWTSGHEDILQAGLRVRVGDKRDLFLLKMKYGLDIVQNV